MIFIKRIKNRISQFMIKHNREVLYMFRSELLKTKISNCRDNGVTNEKLADKEVVISLTTYGKRLYSVSLTIESIMQGTMKPNRLILWLQDDLKEEPLPYSLRLQMTEQVLPKPSLFISGSMERRNF